MPGVSPVEVLNIGDGLRFRQNTVLGTMQLSDRIYWNKINPSPPAPVSVTLPKASDVPGQVALVTNLMPTGNVATILPFAGDTINGLGSLALVRQYQSAEFISDGAATWVVTNVQG